MLTLKKTLTSTPTTILTLAPIRSQTPRHKQKQKRRQPYASTPPIPGIPPSQSPIPTRNRLECWPYERWLQTAISSWHARGFCGVMDEERSELLRRIGACKESAVENQGLASHKGCALRAHPHDGFCDFHRRSKTADGMEPDRKLLRLRCVPEPLAHGRFDHRGTYDVYANAASRSFERGGLRHPNPPVFARAIRGCPGRTNPAPARPLSHAGPPTPPPHHPPNLPPHATPP